MKAISIWQPWASAIGGPDTVSLSFTSARSNSPDEAGRGPASHGSGPAWRGMARARKGFSFLKFRNPPQGWPACPGANGKGMSDEYE